LHGYVTAQRTVVVEVFPAQGQSIDALTQHVNDVVFDEHWVARISNAVCRRLQQTELAIEHTQQHDTGVAGHAAAIKSALHNASAKMSKFDLACSNFFGTVWHWQSFVVIGVRYQ
jgi:hypothetical protein